MLHDPQSFHPLEPTRAQLTELGHGAVSDALYERARAAFDEDVLVDLTLLVVAINGWNRINIAARTIGGHYRVPRAA